MELYCFVSKKNLNSRKFFLVVDETTQEPQSQRLISENAKSFSSFLYQFHFCNYHSNYVLKRKRLDMSLANVTEKLFQVDETNEEQGIV